MGSDQKSLFQDRTEAGQRLAEHLNRYRGTEAVVLAIPRGGVPVAVVVAEKLEAKLDLIFLRKIPIPYEPEAGYGAVTEDGTIVLNEPLVRQLGLRQQQIERQVAEVRSEIVRRSIVFSRELPWVDVDGVPVILVDDGLASGFTMVAAIQSVRKRNAAGITVAVPTASKTAHDMVKPMVDELVCLAVGHGPYFAVASYYIDWYDLTDQDVLGYLKRWQTRHQYHQNRNRII